MLSQAAWASSGRLYLRRVEFEPRDARRPFRLPAGTRIDEEQARQTADEFRAALAAEGYRDATVRASLVPAGVRQADLRFEVRRGPHYRIRQIAFSGDPVFPPAALRRTLHLQGAPFSDVEIGGGLARLRSFYVSRGYFDARVERGEVSVAADKVALTIAVNAGPHYRVRGGDFPAAGVCSCLLESRRQAGTDGALEFSSRIELELIGRDGAEYRLSTAEGPAYTVGRIEFRGNHALSDATLRRALLLEEGGVFDGERLRLSLARLSRLPLIDPVTEANLDILPDAAAQRADLIVTIHERPRGRWAFSAPALPFGFAGAFEARIQSRLPGWSTWYGMAALTGLPPSLARLLPFASGKHLLPFLGVGRPYLPGLRWSSGFFYAPQLGWQSAAMSYGAFRVPEGVRKLLRLDPAAGPALAVPVSWSAPGHPEDGVLLCSPPTPHRLKRLAGAASAMLLGAGGS